MSENARKPSIRFAGFDDAWEQRKLDDFVSSITRTDSESTAPVKMISAASGFINQSEKYSSDNAGQSLAKYILLKRGELAYNHGASKYKPYGSCFALNVDEARIPFVYHCFGVGDNNPYFTAIVLNDTRVDKQLRRLVSSGARMDGLLNISFEAYKTIEVMMPSNAEQDKIFKFFADLDNLITLHQRKYEKMVFIKKSMLEKMFPKNGSSIPEIRFVGFTDPWEQRKVINVAPLQRGFDLPRQKMQSGCYPVVMSNGISGYHSEYKVKAPGVVTGRSGTIGNIHYINQDYWPHNTALWVTDFRGNYPLYIFYMYQNLNLIRFGTGSGVPTLNRNDVHSVEVYLPRLKEQQRISTFLHDLDNLITLHQRKLEKLKNIKKSMLERMFV
ncbi:restriction endonuclease subunit S [uncultured Sphaerochaeta sp.]|uniref:restriction endonuclease subunit S n=1 Tax=uncultured Sphaerochaeta sp. TaxID=886478 RepID=UPI002A0A5D70|nr:restriction endonuclease subunit S [uncultured Sphaerochaeta sp.]